MNNELKYQEVNCKVYLNYVAVNRFVPFLTKVPRRRFVEYYQDLYHLEQKQIDECTFTQGDQGNYAELGSIVLDNCTVNGEMESIDTLICAIWSHEFDPNYSSSGPYFSNRYKIPDVFDISDQGSISTFLSLKILLQYLYSGHSQKIALIGLEQNCIPRNMNDNPVMPDMSGAGVLLFSHKPQMKHKNGVRLVYADVISETEILNKQFDVIKIVIDISKVIGIDYTQATLVLKKSSTLWKSYKRLSANNLVIKLHESMGSFTNFVGLLPFYIYINYLFNDFNNKTSSQYIVIMDEDVESLAVGIAILEIV